MTPPEDDTAQAQAMLDANYAECQRVADGLIPTIPAHAPADVQSKFWAGDVEAASHVASGLHDFQRLPMALHMALDHIFPPSAVEIVFDLGMTQSHGFRQISDDDIYTILDYIDQCCPAHIPNPVRLYRGGPKDGLSWTTDPQVAKRFAEMQGGAVTSKTVERSEIAYYTDSRGEKEVILWPANWGEW